MANQDFRVKNGLQVGLGASVVGIVTAESFTGSAVGLTNVPSASLTGTISSERLSGTYDIDITGTMSGDSINVGTGNTGVFAKNDGTLLVTGIATFKDRVIFDSTNSIQIPVGTEAEKDNVGTAVTGQIRYNTTNSQFEGFGPGNDWGSLGGVKDVDGDTYVKPESSPGSDEDALTFFTGGTERAVIDSDGNVGIATTNPTATLDVDGTLNVSGISTFQNNVEIHSTGYLQIPVGLSNDRPTGTGVTLGQIRYNSELSQFEGYGAGNAWGSLGGIKDVDQDTYITAESSAGADEDALTFFTGGTEKAVIDSTGKVGIGSTQPTSTLDLDGTLNVSGISTFLDNVAIGTSPTNTYLSFPTGDSISSADIIRAGSSALDYTLYALKSDDQHVIRQFTTGNYTVSVGSANQFTISNVDGWGLLGGPHPGGVQDSDTAFVVRPDTSTELRYNYSKKFETTTDGFKVLNGTSETAVISGPQNIILDPSPDDVVAIVEGDISAAGVSTITGITTTNIAVGNLIQEVDGVISAGTTVTSVGISSLTISNVSLGSATNQEFTFANQTPTGIVRIKGDLYIDGTRTEINSTTLTIDDLNVVVASGATNGLTADTAGLTVDGANAYLKYNYNAGTNETWELNKNVGIGTDNATAKLDVVGFTELDNLNVSAASTFASDLDINASVDISTNLTVDGLTDLDELNVSGISTFSDDLIVGTATTGVVARTDGTLNVSGISTFLDNVNIGTAATTVDLPGLYLKGNSATTNFLQNPSISIGGTTTSRYYDTFLVDDPNVQYVRHWANNFDINFSVSDDRLFVVSNIDGASSVSPAGVVDGHIAFKINPETSTELRYNKVKKLETTGYGVSVYGGANVSGIATFQDSVVLTGVGKSLVVGPSSHQLILEHDPLGAGVIRQNSDLFLCSPGIVIGAFDVTATGNRSADFFPNGSVTLYHNNNQKFQTTSDGITVTGRTLTSKLHVSGISTFASDLDINADVNVSGIVTAQLFSGNGGSLTNVSAFEAYKSDISERAYKTDEISGSLSYASNQNINIAGVDQGVKSIISRDGKVVFVSEYDLANRSLGSGRIHIYERTGANFTSIGIVTQTSHSSPGAAQTTTCFGPIIACNADGSIFAVGSPQGVPNGTSGAEGWSWWHQTIGPGQQSVHIFQKNGSTITNIGILTSPSLGNASTPTGGDSFGGALAFSDDGSKLYVGSPNRYHTPDSGTTYYDGAIYVYDKSGLTYNYVGIISVTDASSGIGQGGIGQQLACSSDGNILFSGSPGYYRLNPNGGSGTVSGIIQIYDRSGSSFTNVGIVSSGYRLSGSNAGNNIGVNFGNTLACSDDGTYLYSTSYSGGTDVDDYSHGKLHLFKRESNTYSEVSSYVLEPELGGQFNKLGWGLACDSLGSKVLASENNRASTGPGNQGYVHNFVRVGDNITRVGFTTSGLQRSGSYPTLSGFGISLDLSGSGEVGIVGSPEDVYSGYSPLSGNVFFIQETRGTSVYSDIATGNIGIKTDAPKATLDVNGTLNVSGISTFQDDVNVGTGGTVAFFDISAGRVGIGSTTPTKVLDVGGTLGVSGASVFTSNVRISPSSTNQTALSFDTELNPGGFITPGISFNMSNTSRYGIYNYYNNTDGYVYHKLDSNSNFEIGLDGGSFIVGANNFSPITSKSFEVKDDAETYLTHNKNKKLETTGYGVTVTGGLNVSGVSTIANDLYVSGTGSGIKFDAYNANTTVSANYKLRIEGNNSHYMLYAVEGGSSQYVKHKAENYDYNTSIDTGKTFSVSNNNTVDAVPDSEIAFKITPNASTELRYNYNKKLETTGYGVTVTGGLNVSGITTIGNYLNIGGSDISISSTTINGDQAITFDGTAGNLFTLTDNLTTGNLFVVNDISGFSVFEVDVDGTVRMGLATNDKVGIGSTTPTAKLDVDGTLNVSGVSTFSNRIDANGALDVDGDTELDNLNVSGEFTTQSNLDVGGFVKQELHTPEMPVGLNDDIGEQWTKIEMGSAIERIRALVYCGDGIVLAGSGTDSGDGDIYRSTDYGQTWIKIEMGSTIDQIRSLVYCGNGIVFAGDSEGDIWKSTDFGLTWNTSTSTTASSIVSLVYCGDGIVIAGSSFGSGGGDVWRSTDFGANWTNNTVSSDLESIYSLVYIGNGNVLAGGGDDGGHISGTTYQDGDGDIYKSTDYGQTWTKIEPGTYNKYILSLVYCGDGVVLAGAGIDAIDYSGDSSYDGDIYRSTDYGSTWTRIELDTSLDQIPSLVYCGNGIVLAGSGADTNTGDIWKSDDYGQNWTKIEMGSSLETISSLVYCGNGIVLAGSGNGSGEGDIYRSDVGFSQASTIQGIHHEHLTGNIGIGSTQPTAKLDVAGGLNVSGNVGIGSTIPAYTLDLGESPSTIRIVSDDGGTAIRMGAGDQNHDFTMLRVDGATGQHDGESASQAYGFSLRYIGSLTGNNNKLRIVADNQTGTPINAFTMLQDGSVGINSINPTATLDVNGSVAIKNHSIVSITTSHTSTAGISSTIDTFAISANDLAEYTVYVENGSNIQAQKVLVMQDGTTAYSQEYAVMSQPSKIVSIEALISGSNVLLRATPETGVSGITTYKIVRGGLV